MLIGQRSRSRTRRAAALEVTLTHRPTDNERHRAHPRPARRRPPRRPPGLRLLIDAEPDLTVVAEAGDGIEAVRAALATEIDLAILDVSMPRMTGINAAREILGARPEVRVLMLSMHDSAEYLFEALRAGASGYVLKSGVDRDLIAGLPRRHARRALPLPLRHPHADPRPPRAPERRRTASVLTPRETRDRQADRRGPQLQGDRRAARHQPQDRRTPPREHPREARNERPRRAHPLRHPTRHRRAVSQDGRARAPGRRQTLGTRLALVRRRLSGRDELERRDGHAAFEQREPRDDPRGRSSLQLEPRQDEFAGGTRLARIGRL